MNPRWKKWRFGFDHVFSLNQGQEDVWEATEPLVQSAIDGFNVWIFTYGQTGSSETYTMLSEPPNEGLSYCPICEQALRSKTRGAETQMRQGNRFQCRKLA